MFTADDLAAKKKEAEAERNRLLTSLHQLDGAIGMLAILIREAEKPDTETEMPDETSRTPAS